MIIGLGPYEMVTCSDGIKLKERLVMADCHSKPGFTYKNFQHASCHSVWSLWLLISLKTEAATKDSNLSHSILQLRKWQ